MKVVKQKVRRTGVFIPHKHCSYRWKLPLLRVEVQTAAWNFLISSLKRNPESWQAETAKTRGDEFHP